MPRLTVLVVVALVAIPQWATAQLRAEVFAAGLNSPVAFVQDPTQSNVQFIVEQFGRIRIVQNGQLLASSFLDLQGLIAAGGERGLLGLAFAPDYASSRRFFVNFTNSAGHTVIARFVRSASDPLLADALSRFDLLFPGGSRFITQPFSNHNGGDLHFGADGYLYIGMGDGGSGNDPNHVAQNLDSLLGKMLRIDVSVSDSHLRGYDIPLDNPYGPGVAVADGALTTGQSRWLTWASGLRNPWRFSVDHLAVGGRGAVLIADVGQNAWEEVNYQPAGRAGRNYGWRIREGAHVNTAFGDSTTAGLTDPLIEYSHAVGSSVTGGPVHRGTGLGLSYFGRYFFADITGRVWSARLTIDRVTGEATDAAIEEHTAELGGASVLGLVSAFGTDAACRLYIVSLYGTVFRVLPASGNTTSSCAPPDPFLSDGGGVFLGGGWVPFDHPLAGATPTPTPSPTPTPTPTPSPTPTTCVGAAPMSDWVCVNAGWVPPNHPLALGAGTPTPTPTPTPSPTPSSCSGSDPFAGIPGLIGVCVNGGWVPSNHPLGSGKLPPRREAR